MTLDRDQTLEEMGLSPQWKLRDQLSVVRSVVKKLPPSEVIFSTEPDSGRGKVPVQPLSQPTSSQPESGAGEAVATMGWDALYQTISGCRACGLCTGRKQAVPGVGDENADWLFIGEGPGAEEDERGEPFVGQAGKLLDSMLSAIDLRRGNDVYIANAVKCRPPGNRTPEAAEMAACAPYLRRQIALIQPRMIVLLGRAAVHAVLGEEGSLASLRGKTLAYRNGEQDIPVIVTYHPAYLLRTLPDKAKSWEDLCRARALMRLAKANQTGKTSTS